MTEPIDIGHGVSISYVQYEGKDCGIIETHAGKDGQPCSGYVHFRDQPPAENQRRQWTIEQADPLTLSPSILCTTCGHHGFIREGKWVPA